MLDGIVVFLAVARRRSFTAAGAELGVTAQAVSQAVKDLEARIGAPLFTRTTRSVGLTQAGERLLAGASPGASAIEGAIEEARTFGARPAGLLRINLPSIASVTIVEPLIAGFCDLYPEIELELFTDDRLVDIVDEGFDAGIRLGEAVDADMVGVRLTRDERFVVVAAPTYLATHGGPERPEDLRAHRCINFRQTTRGGIYRWEFEDGGREFSVGVKGPLIVNSSTMAIAACASGVGLAYTTESLVRALVEQGLLEFVLEPYWPQSGGFFLYYPSRAQTLPKLRAFIDFLRTRLAAASPG
jgi:DNA-binding transcriptional LysR family regulator